MSKRFDTPGSSLPTSGVKGVNIHLFMVKDTQSVKQSM